ncbi:MULTISPECIES: TlpA disulfide reductase family protein [Gluconobacter]|uniref:TlpA family protein disulfide reductase n=1 Tax=Gluconobacter cadivus TaxID=2728101 RepID=A0ABR9YUD2_9PROT|nr:MULTISPECIES: TlpA disulfide reductase family protein [Gluconobacter]MBF0887497.1 TlpA family protein disulfide reductase [Gluconobacter cadivus]MBS1058567.1 TlpA family protein disulfide reductase [Gluconobacter sp. Dm-44]
MIRKQIDRRTLLGGAASLAAAASLCNCGLGNSARAGDGAQPVLPSLAPGAPKLEPVNFQLKGPDGTMLALSSLRGRPFILHLWATWCPPCRLELPALNAFIEKTEASIPVIPVAVASPLPKVMIFLAQGNLPHIAPWTLGQHEFSQWFTSGEPSLPMTCVVDSQGRLRASVEGEMAWSAPDSQASFEKVLSGLQASKPA